MLTNQTHPRTAQEHKRSGFDSMLVHLHPRKVSERALEFTRTWGLGGMSVVLVMLLVGTGILLLFVYDPVPEKAYDSMIVLQNEVQFGQLVRNVHYWSGNILVVVVFLHMLRVFSTGGFHNPRQLNWLIGLCLLLLVLLSNFTGYLLPWDQLAFWAVTTCTSMVGYIPGVGAWLQEMIRGGADIGPATLSIFFALHIAIIPVCLFMIMSFHFWRVRKDGGVVTPRSHEGKSQEKAEYVSTVPNLVVREMVVALVLIAFVLVFSLLFDAPLEDRANPGMSPNPAKAPWYFSGIQELLLHFHPFFAIVVIPLLVTVALLLLPRLKNDPSMVGVWFCSHKGRRMSIVSAAIAVVVTPLAIVGDEFIDFSRWTSGVLASMSNGLIPVTVLMIAILGFYRVMKRSYSASNDEAIQALAVLLLGSFVVLTVTGIWFRGPGMALMWPHGLIAHP